jgi:hypothetical protein
VPEVMPVQIDSSESLTGLRRESGQPLTTRFESVGLENRCLPRRVREQARLARRALDGLCNTVDGKRDLPHVWNIEEIVGLLETPAMTSDHEPKPDSWERLKSSGPLSWKWTIILGLAFIAQWLAVFAGWIIFSARSR